MFSLGTKTLVADDGGGTAQAATPRRGGAGAMQEQRSSALGSTRDLLLSAVPAILNSAERVTYEDLEKTLSSRFGSAAFQARSPPAIRHLCSLSIGAPASAPSPPAPPRRRALGDHRRRARTTGARARGDGAAASLAEPGALTASLEAQLGVLCGAVCLAAVKRRTAA